jgi:hypothetical protein
MITQIGRLLIRAKESMTEGSKTSIINTCKANICNKKSICFPLNYLVKIFNNLKYLNFLEIQKWNCSYVGLNYRE